MPKFFHEILRRYVEVPESPERVVSLYPSITDAIVLLGAEDRLVGISSWCPVYVKGIRKPVVGSPTQANLERLKSADPDLVFTTTGIQRSVSEELAKAGFSVIPIPTPKTVYGILDNLVVIGSLLGLGDRARKLAAQISREMSQMGIEPPRGSVYVEIWPGKYSITAGALSFITDYLRLAGYQNIFAQKLEAYFTPSFEEVVEKSPDAVVLVYETKRDVDQAPPEKLFRERGWANISAVRANRVLVRLEQELPLSHSGPSFINVVKRLSRELEEIGL